jgi:hypothetical protein
MTTRTRYAVLFALAVASLAAGCGDSTSNPDGPNCPTDEMESARADAEPLYHVGCDNNGRCGDDGEAVCWNDARDAVAQHLENGESFTLHRAGPLTPGGSDIRVWQVAADGSGTYYRRGPGDDVVEPGEEPSCNTSRTEFETVARETDETLELRVGEERWRSLPELRSREQYCRGESGPPNEFDGAWVGVFDSPHGEAATAVAIRASGDPVVGGRVEESVHDQSYRGGDSDGLLAGYTEDGDRQWTRLIGGDGIDKVNDVATDADGNIYATGTAGSAIGDTTHNGEYADGFVAKYSPDGERLWAHMIGTEEPDFAEGVAVDDDEGDVYVVGNTYGALTDQSIEGDESAAYLTRLSTDGKRTWTRLVATEEPDSLGAVAVGPDGGIGVAGTTSGALGEQAGDISDADGIAAAYDASGNRRWLDQFGTPSREGVEDVTFGPDGLYVGGSTKGALSDSERDDDRTDTDGFVVAYDASGEHRWTRLLAGRVDDQVLGLATDGDTLHAVGQTADRLGSLDNANYPTGFHARLSDSANDWSTRFVSSRDDVWTGDVATTDTAIYLTGATRVPWGPEPPNERSWAGYLGRFDR